MSGKKRAMRVLGAAVLLAGFAGLAQEATDAAAVPVAGAEQELAPVVVTATRTETPVTRLGQSVELIGAEQIRASRLPYVTDVLQEVPGLDIKSSGTRDSSTTNLRIRGMEGYHSKILIDGVPYIDCAGTQAQGMLGNIALNQIDHIEVVKGATSLQGSMAMGGVVNIVTRRAEDDGLHGSVGVEGGSHGRINSNASLYGKNGVVDYLFGLGRERERGISNMDAKRGTVNADDDPYRAQNYNGRIGIQLDENWRAEVGGLFQDIDEEYDNSWTPARGDATWIRRTMGHARLAGSELFDGKLDTQLRYSWTRADRYSYSAPQDNTYRYTGDARELNWQGTLHINERNDLTAGVNYSTEHARNYEFYAFDMNTFQMAPVTGSGKTLDRHHRTTAYYLSYQTEPVDNLFINLNTQFLEHSAFGDEWTADGAVRYLIEPTGTTLKTSMGKGYRSPSVYELYGALPGMQLSNPDLEPETSRTWDLGIEQDLLDKAVTVGTTYFENRVDDFIDYIYDPNTWLGQYQQIDGTRRIRGFESFVAWRPLDVLSLRLTHTYQRVRTEKGGKALYTPKQKLSADATWRPLADGPIGVNLGGVYVGSRWASETMKLDDYVLMHATLSYDFSSALSAYVRVDNLLNENYTVTPDYKTYGRCYYVGVNYSF
ncbi:TonB-dependent receptor plug domain-containing protein [Oligosphaera ethanolica]|uniref:Vitamin B12 transporter n=1 Tax=Oligosphaera ethanolica TaxID=760260 RepID=A0AAE4AP12_9BACT|nr:TonB-dependent receptor [Oligosphaera ethanolica]MDQ0290814.1 vitamin B12 transporter [Oligosphaera ethanolica]